MTKHVLQPLALTLGCALLLAGCIADDSDGDNSGCGTTGQGARGLYVVNQGNTGYSILGTLDWIDTEADTLASDIFSRANGQALGENPQNAVISGSKMYISEFTSNRIWVVSAATSALLGQIEVQQPNRVYAHGAYVYATSNTGTVSRIDTASLQIDRQLTVGPNPVGMVAAGGYLYVANSDGYNYPTYDNGKSVSKISLSAFEETTRISVGLNPQNLAADAAGNVFVYCGGNYADIGSVIQKITADDHVSDFTSASMMATDGEKIYLIKQSYDANWNSTYEYFTMNTLTADTLAPADDAMQHVKDDAPDNPTGIFIDPESHEIYITSDAVTAADGSTNAYTSPGSVMYYCPRGYFQQRYTVGVHPVWIAFRN